MPRTIRTEAIVAGRSELGESDRLITLLARTPGKLRAVAPGARRSRRRFAGCLELFALIDVSITDRGEGKLARLEEATLLRSHGGISTDLVRIAQGSYLTELTCALLAERDEAEASFRMLQDALDELDSGVLSATSLRVFELGVLDVVGLRPVLDTCVECGARQSDRWVFDHGRGGVLCDRCCGDRDPPGSEILCGPGLALLRELAAGHRPARPDTSAMDAARDLLGRIIESHTGRPLRARAFLRQVAGKR